MAEEKDPQTTSERISHWVKKHPLWAAVFLLLAVGVGVVVYWAIWADSSPTWTGFGTYDEAASGPRAKTLWDWLGLLIVPAALAAGAYWFNRTQKETELKIAEKARAADREIAQARQQQATLESYYDRMTELLLEHDLRESAADSEVRSIAQARTVAVVKNLAGEWNRQLFAFLKASKLITRDSAIINPSGIDFSGADLREVNLSGTDLSKVDLSKGDLRGANLRGANLSEANLSEADLRGANLSEADLRWADLSRSNMAGVNLHYADLGRAKLIAVDLSDSFIEEFDISYADLSNVNLNNSFVGQANFSNVNFSNATLRNTFFRGTNLTCVNLKSADLNGASIWKANLTGAKNWTLDQFDEIGGESPTMPDGVTIGGYDYSGPTFEEWKAQYLAQQGGG